MNLYSINCGYFKLDGGAMFGVVPKSIWNPLVPADENNMCSWALRSLLIEDEGKLILVDTGMGDKQSEKFFAHYYLHGDDSLDKSLAARGFHRDDITDVFLTHLHFDHCGGAIERKDDKFVPAFKNATYWSNVDHWKWAIFPNPREKASFLKENILPIAESGQLQFLNERKKTENRLDEAEFSSNINIRFTYGHTDAMMFPQILYKNKTIDRKSVV
jgi:glyoxylase-like metal-dependent hydrolase (beta-lactamase superfamily II)